MYYITIYYLSNSLCTEITVLNFVVLVTMTIKKFNSIQFNSIQGRVRFRCFLCKKEIDTVAIGNTCLPLT